MRSVLCHIALFIILLTATPPTLKAGGQATVTRNSINPSGTSSSHYIYPTTESWKNSDTIPVTIKFDDGRSLTLEPEQVSEYYSFSKTTSYYIEGYPSAAGTILMADLLRATNISANSVSLTWGPYSYYDGSPTVKYQILRTTDSLTSGYPSWQPIGYSTSVDYTDSTAAAGTTYGYMVNGCLPSDNCLYHNTNQISVTTSAAPSVPTTVSTTAPTATTTSTSTSTATTKTTKKTAVNTPAVSPTTPEPTAESVPASAISLTAIGDQKLADGQRLTVNEDRVSLTGTAGPNSTIYVLIHSEPIKFQTTSDDNGAWSLDIPLSDLSAGEHTVSVAYNNSDDPASYSQVGVFDYQAKTTSETTDQTSSWVPGIIGLLVVFICALVWFVILKRRRAAQIYQI
jgi:hypothetical protein